MIPATRKLKLRYSISQRSLNTTMTKLFWLLLCTTGLLFSGSATAQISVNRSVIEFAAGEKVQDVEILNSGDFKIYLDIKIAEILSPESENPQRNELTDPRTAPVLVSPAQVLIPPGQRKRVRIIMREAATDKDRVYRMAVKPYTGKLKIDNTEKDKKSSAIKVLVGYDLLLLSRPSAKDSTIEVTRTNENIQFINRGNTNVLLRKIVQCDRAETECLDLQPNRLYAGETYSIKLPKPGSADDFPVKVWQSVGLENSRSAY